MIIKFYCLRHGEKRGKDHPEGEDGLTEKGKRQVIAAAAEYLRDVTFDLVLFSGLNRARQTAEIAIDITGQKNSISISVETGLDYRWSLDKNTVPQFSPVEAEKKLKDSGIINTTVYDWLEIWPPAFGMRQMMLATIRRRASELFNKSMYTNKNVLMTGHSPVLEMAVPNPHEFPRLKEADICLYNVEISGEEVKIVSATYLPCPAVE